MAKTWLMIIKNGVNTCTAKTVLANDSLLYRAAAKWLLRGQAAQSMLESFWECIDPEDNQLEDALLEQFLEQAEKTPSDPQISNVRTRNYAVDILVTTDSYTPAVKSCNIELKLWVHVHSLRKKINTEKIMLNLTLICLDEINNESVELIRVSAAQKTPFQSDTIKNRVEKKSSKLGY